MLITFECAGCRSALEIEADAAGQAVVCPTCRAPLTVPRKGIEPGTTLGGDYRIERLLGRGGMGHVYLARQMSLDRRIALKILPPRFAAERDNVERFLGEIKLLARLDHPHIVTAYQAGEDAGVLFLAMAYVDGASLEQYLWKGEALGERAALEVAVKVAVALEYAWTEHRLLHRDIKPANILLDARGEPRLVDLGLAKCMTGQGGLTANNELLGSPNYMSPEQATGSCDLDCRTDMYSLGLTLHHMLTGRRPFEGTGLMETLRRQVAEPLPDPRDFNPSISEACVCLLETMLAKRREDRHPDWAALRADLRRVLAGRPPTLTLPAPRESTLRRRGALVQVEPARLPPARTAPRWRFRLAVASVAVAVVLLLGALGAVHARKSVPSPLSVLAPAAPPSVTRELPAATAAPPAAAAPGPTEEQVQAVRDALLKTNPGMGEMIVTREPDGLHCRFENGAALKDLRPLAGLPLAGLDLTDTSVADLSPLRGMPLLTLILKNTRVTDFTVLGSLPLQRLELLAPVTDLEALRGLSLRALTVVAPVRDIDVLAEMPLVQLALLSADVHDLAPLARVRTLRDLNVQGSPVEDISALAGLPLQRLALGFTQVRDLTPLAGMPLALLVLAGTPVHDLAPLAGLPIVNLSLSRAPVSDLAPLKGMPLSDWVDLRDTAVSDLSPLQTTQVSRLILVGSRVSDLTPIEAMPTLSELILAQDGFAPAPVEDLSPLARSKVRLLILQSQPLHDLHTLAGAPLRDLELRDSPDRFDDIDKLPDYLPRLQSLRLYVLPQHAPEYLLACPGLSVCVGLEACTSVPEFLKARYGWQAGDVASGQ